MHVSLLKFLSSPTSKAAVEFCVWTQGFWNSFDAQTLLEHLLVSHGGTYRASTGLAGLSLAPGAGSDALSHGFLLLWER